MVTKQSRLKIVDNSGGKILRVFQLSRYGVSQKYSSSGDMVLGSLLRYKVGKRVHRKQLCGALILTSRRPIQRRNGMSIRFDESRGILFQQSKMVGTRVFGPASKEVEFKRVYSRFLVAVKQFV